jgi:hypothetical protein
MRMDGGDLPYRPLHEIQIVAQRQRRIDAALEEDSRDAAFRRFFELRNEVVHAVGVLP